MDADYAARYRGQVPSTCFLASKHVSGLSTVLTTLPNQQSVVFVPTAGSCFDSPYWVERERQWLIDSGFAVQDLELVGATESQVTAALANAQLVYVAGGNTYFLLQHMQATGFLPAIADFDGVYVGVSAGAIVMCPDIAYIADMDDRSLAPELTDTTGAGLLEPRIIPHVNDARFKPKIDRILSTWPADIPAITLTDDQAIILEHNEWRVVSSPAGPPLA